MILDESKESDETYQAEGVEFLMSKAAAAAVQNNASTVAIDYVEDAQGKGFRLFLKSSKQPSTAISN